MREVLPGKFIRLRGEVFDDWPVLADRLERLDKGLERLDKGDSTNAASHYLDALKDKNVSTIMHLSSIEYSEAAVFKRAVFNHFDLPFEDCQVPSDSIVDEFLRIAKEARSVVAVYDTVQTLCLQGRARTGDELIALYLMKHHGFTAREAMCCMQICSPGTMLALQHSASSLGFAHNDSSSSCPFWPAREMHRCPPT